MNRLIAKRCVLAVALMLFMANALAQEPDRRHVTPVKPETNQVKPPPKGTDEKIIQQYISGERVDGIFAVVGLIGSVWNLATGSILPAIYNRAGLNEETAVSLGFSSSNVYDVLYNEKYFRSICGVLILASVIGAAMNCSVIPPRSSGPCLTRN